MQRFAALLSAILRCSLFGLLLFVLVGPAKAQWQQIANFNEEVTALYFPKGDCSASVGFAGTMNGSIEKTTDGGNTWTKVLSQQLNGSYVSNIAFKDSLIGWAAIGNQSGAAVQSSIWKTTDGGDTWFSVGVQGCFASIYYQQATKLLFASNWIPKNSFDLVSHDEGATWQPFFAPNFSSITSPQHNGFAFATPLNGVLSSVGGTGYWMTNDGGQNWTQISPTFNVGSNPSIEAYQPLALACSTDYVLASEGAQEFYRSTDGGLTWNPVYHFPKMITGEVVGDEQSLFIQTSSDVELSTSGGISWTSVGGPGSDFDTRMAIRGGLLFAGDTKGRLYKYQYGTSGKTPAQLSVWPDTLKFSASACSIADEPLALSATMACTECSDSIRLIGTLFSGSPFFSIVSGPILGDGISFSDQMTIQHRPAATAFDTAILTLTFSQYGQTSTQNIVLLGQSIPHQNERVLLEDAGGASVITPHAGDAVTEFIVLQDSVGASIGLTTVSCTIPYDSRILSLKSVKALNAWAKASEQDNPNQTMLTFTSTAHNVRPGEQIAEVAFLATLSTNDSSFIAMTDLAFNPFDPSFENCTLTAVPVQDTIMVVMAGSCGDSTLREIMLGHPLAELLSVMPDPVSGSDAHILVDLHLSKQTQVSFVIRDLTGRVVLPAVSLTLGSGESRTTLPISGIPDGAYMVIVQTPEATLTRKVVVSR